MSNGNHVHCIKRSGLAAPGGQTAEISVCLHRGKCRTRSLFNPLLNASGCRTKRPRSECNAREDKWPNDLCHTIANRTMSCRCTRQFKENTGVRPFLEYQEPGYHQEALYLRYSGHCFFKPR